MWRLGSEEIDVRFCADSSYENLQSSEYIWEPMDQAVTESKNVDSPSNNVIVFVFFHVLPSEFMPIPQHEVMHVEFSPSTENIGFSTEFFPSTNSNDLHFNRVDVIVLEVGEVDNNLLETVIRSAVEYDGFEGRFISNITYIHCSEFKKLGVRTFLAL